LVRGLDKLTFAARKARRERLHPYRQHVDRVSYS